MKNIKVTRTGPKSIRFLGRTGENKAETMAFNCRQFIEDYGEGQAFLFFKRPGADYAYPVVCEQNGENVTWVVNAADTEFEGIGELEIQWHVDGVIAKSASYPVKIEESLPTGGEAPPEPIKPWFDKLSQQIADISGVTPEQIRGVLEAYLDEQPIPAGPPGEKGEKGDPGETTFVENPYDDTALKAELSKKLTAPETASVGQMFAVKEVNDDGTLALEAVDKPVGGGENIATMFVDDVLDEETNEIKIPLSEKEAERATYYVRVDAPALDGAESTMLIYPMLRNINDIGYLNGVFLDVYPGPGKAFTLLLKLENIGSASKIEYALKADYTDGKPLGNIMTTAVVTERAGALNTCLRAIRITKQSFPSGTKIKAWRL